MVNEVLLLINIGSTYNLNVSLPWESGGNHGQLVELKKVGHIVELFEEAAAQFGPPVDKVLLQRRQGVAGQGPQESVLTEERVVSEQTAQDAVPGHCVERRDPKSVAVPDLRLNWSLLCCWSCMFRTGRSLGTLYIQLSHSTTPLCYFRLMSSEQLAECGSQVRNALKLIKGLKTAHGHILVESAALFTLKPDALEYGTCPNKTADGV